MRSEVSYDQALAYIDRYKDFAISEMERTGIPASIKMGQAILESDYGRSKLATLASNHFGAKCHNTWNGARYYHDDDAPNECFRKYKSVYESFVDHSKVLAKKRYESLYYLDPYDYKSWAKGLKKAGYATNPAYSTLLINIIERYGLHNLDRYEEVPRFAQAANAPANKRGEVLIGMNLLSEEVPVSAATSLSKKTPTVANGLTYVYYDKEVSPDQIASTYQMPVEQVLRFNDMLPGFMFPQGMSIYLKEKRNDCISGLTEHRVKEGETMFGIAQAYGVKLRSLYHMNSIKFPKQPKPGVILRLKSNSAAFVSDSRSKPTKSTGTSSLQTTSTTKSNLVYGSGAGNSAKTSKVGSEQMLTEGRSAVEHTSQKSEKLPVRAVYGSTVPALPSKSNKSESVFYHTVQEYDTVITIAQAYGITVAKLKALNGATDEGLSLRPGMKLRID